MGRTNAWCPGESPLAARDSAKGVAAHEKVRKSGPMTAGRYVAARRAFWASSASRFRYDSPSIVRISAWCVSRSMSATAHEALGKMVFQSLNAKLVISTIDFRS
jgi:hypothetical protein